MHSRKQRQGFTLIEVLVVVAIIALLVAILFPSLARARVQAKIVSCQVNLKQIANTTATYRTEEKGYVPVLFNYYAGPPHGAPARACWLSVALRKYSEATVRLKSRYGGEFDPEAVWDEVKEEEYANRAMPDHYACPFERYGPLGYWVPVRDTPNFAFKEHQGRFESVHTWLWEDIVRGGIPHGMHWPLGGDPFDGLPKYTVFSWNRVNATGGNPKFPNGDAVLPIPGCYSAESTESKSAYRQWTLGDLRRMRTGNMSNTTVNFCAQGEHAALSFGKYPRINAGSHHRGQGGGTNAIFADGHVEWVKGTRIGWP